MCPSSATDFKTLQELWSKKSSSYHYLRIFGCVAYAHTNNGNLEPWAINCIFIEYLEGIKGISRGCIFIGM